MLEDLQIRHYSRTTIRLYLYAVRAFAKHFGKPPDQRGAEHIRRYQLFLTKEKKVSTSTYVMMICAHTLHRKVAIERIPYPRRERKLPLILSRDEVKALLEAPSDLRDRAMLAILYGSGLRVSEVTRLKVADIDSARNVLHVGTRSWSLVEARRSWKRIAAFAVDQRSGMLTSTGWTASQGRTPRFIGFDPSHSFLCVTNEQSDTVITFRADAGGRLTVAGSPVQNASPVSIAFAD
jgi:integrase